MKILVVNGPNLNLLGQREEVYGDFSYTELMQYTEENIDPDVSLEWFQSNIEGEIIDKIQLVNSDFDALIINPAGYSHTSVAIHDALQCCHKLKCEVHLTNTASRESFRQVLLTARACNFIMKGLGKDVYHLAVNALRTKIEE